VSEKKKMGGEFAVQETKQALVKKAKIRHGREKDLGGLLADFGIP
jgi:hypothetical protein